MPNLQYELDEIVQMDEGMMQTVSDAVAKKVAEWCEGNEINFEFADYSFSVLVDIHLDT